MLVDVIREAIPAVSSRYPHFVRVSLKEGTETSAPYLGEKTV